MVLHRATPVISHYVNRIRLHPARREGPITRVAEIRLVLLLSVDEEPSVSEFDFFVLKGDHSLQERYPLAGEADDNNIASSRFRKEIAKFPAEIDLTVLVGRFHAVAFNPEGSQKMSEDEISGQGDASCPDHKGRGERWEKELGNSSVEQHWV